MDEHEEIRIWCAYFDFDWKMKALFVILVKKWDCFRSDVILALISAE
jgi:hypothetical protein